MPGISREAFRPCHIKLSVFLGLVIVVFVSVFLFEVTKFKLWKMSTFFRLSLVDHVYLSSSLNVQNWKSIIWQHWLFFILWKTLFCHFLLRFHLNFAGKLFLCWYILIDSLVWLVIYNFLIFVRIWAWLCVWLDHFKIPAVTTNKDAGSIICEYFHHLLFLSAISSRLFLKNCMHQRLGFLFFPIFPFLHLKYWFSYRCMNYLQITSN